jgi:hypothetical protein
MRLPTSTIVMAVATCGLFGMAIRATLTATAPPAGEFYDDEVDAETGALEQRETAQRAKAEEELARVQEREKEKHRKVRAELYGAEPATLGPAFAGIQLGMPEVAITESISSRLETLEETARIDLTLAREQILSSVAIEEQGDDACELGDKLRKTWGAGTVTDVQRLWVNPVTKTRASIGLELYDCNLTIELYATPQEWISNAKTSLVPVGSLGVSVAKLQATIGVPTLVEDDVVRWSTRGVGIGAGETRFRAYLAKGKVVEITATASTTTATYEDIVAQLTGIYGKPVASDDGLRWRSRPVIQLDDDDGVGVRVRVTAGAVP